MRPASHVALLRINLLLLLVAAVAVSSDAWGDEAKDTKDAKAKPANRLALESSPYLLQHAHNPVDWFPWGPEAFAKAKKEGKVVFLSIGYSSCHWCHVMEKESFSHPEVAKLLNEWFVCIKVDREERPDIDHIYMTALHTFGIRGGWPLSMFLTAEGKPIIGGTYWPREDREIDGEKVRGFKTILKTMHDYWTDKQKDILEQADQVANLTNKSLAGTAIGNVLVKLDRSLVSAPVDALKEEFDKVHGGFGSAERQFKGTKFPTPPYLQLLQHEAGRAKQDSVAEMVQISLDRMARGGIYDHLGGGFHRYSTERTWTVPHFEKMLYDNAQLVELYAEDYRTTKNGQSRRVVAETLEFIRREMTSPEGAFWSALDADSDGEEGKFYVWTASELDDVLGAKDAAFIKQVFSKDSAPNFESKYFILCLPKPLAERAKEPSMSEDDLAKKLQPLKEKLFTARSKRVRPFLDTKVLTAWNGQMIAGYALAGQVFEGEKKGSGQAYIDAATRAANFLLKNLRNKEGRLMRTYGARPGQAAEARLNAYLDDYAFLVDGLLRLHDATGKKEWLDEAKTLTDLMIKFYADTESGGFFYTANDHEKLFARAKDQYDGAQPSGNSVAARNLVRLWSKTGDDRYRAAAEKSFKAFAGPLKLNPTALTTLAEALSMYLDRKEKEK